MIDSSFRDPDGFLFLRDDILYRQVSDTYREHYECLISSGLYKNLTDSKMLIAHEEVEPNILKPEFIEFISYPYEWCFSQLKDAALITLEIQKRALKFGMTLKDASAYNIQFHKGKPIFIDTLSFEKYREGEPWTAYKQFCEHFLAPLALMRYKDVRLSQLLRVHIDGIPLDLASLLLPLRSYFNFGILMHIYLHSLSQKRYANRGKTNRKISLFSLLGLIDSLESHVRGLRRKSKRTTWTDYYDNGSNYVNHKKRIVGNFLDKCSPKIVWDLGANTGLFSRIASNNGARVVSFEADPACVEINYLMTRQNGETNILPLLLDITNPSPGIGWRNRERKSLLERGHADTILALALIHHLAISNNLPLNKVADFLKSVCNSLIIEFIPKEDSKVQRLLSTREDVFPDYTKENFESTFSKVFNIEESVEVENSVRILYLMRGRS